VIPLQILAFVGILNALGNPLGSLTLAKNRPDIEFKLTLLVAPVSAGAIFLAVHHGVSAVALAVLGVLVGTVPILLVVLRRLIGLPARALGEALSAPVLLTAAMAAVTALAYQLTATAGSRPLTLAVSTAAGAFTYLGLLVWRQRAYLRELWSSLMAGRSTAVAV
jgi:lipopolysaccharide exporter